MCEYTSYATHKYLFFPGMYKKGDYLSPVVLDWYHRYYSKTGDQENTSIIVQKCHQNKQYL